MKVGIITWWRNNYGSILQALALQQKSLIFLVIKVSDMPYNKFIC